MHIGWSTLAFASGTVATSVVAISVMSLNSQPVRDNAFHVCVATDRVLRLVETEEACPEGQQRLRLQEADTPDVEPPKDSDATKSDKKQDQTSSETQPKKQEPPSPEPAEFKKMPQTPAVSRVKAPFEVVDASGRVILRVDSLEGGTSRAVALYSPSGQPTVLLGADNRGGILRAEMAGGEFASSIIAKDGEAGLKVYDGDSAFVTVGRNRAGSLAARFFSVNSKGVPQVSIGVTRDGNGEVFVGTDAAPLAKMTARDGKGLIEVTNSGGVSLAMLGQSPKGGGLIDVFNSKGGSIAGLTDGPGGGGMLQIADDAGTTVVEANVQGGVGVVRAGPAAFTDRAGLVRLSELRGKR